MHTHLDVTTQGETHTCETIESIVRYVQSEPSRDERPMGREGSASPCKLYALDEVKLRSLILGYRERKCNILYEGQYSPKYDRKTRTK
ncbi:MAG: hypothetical protein [Cressdnaviricota sp.]|nr:MAG: hypothetical protein [Cressdnaviricota sp.]